METGKLCVRCGGTFQADRFHRNKAIPGGLAVYCKDCTATLKRLHYYGISASQYAELLAAQGGACAVCGVHQEGARLPLAVDHDHKCCPGRRACASCIRGLICDPCNRGIGFLGDSKERLLAAASYLARFER